MWASAGQVAVLCYAGCASTRVSVTNNDYSNYRWFRQVKASAMTVSVMKLVLFKDCC